MSDHAAALTNEGGVEPDGLDTPKIVLWGFVSVMIVVGVMFGAAAVYNHIEANLYQERVVQPRFGSSENIVTGQEGLLNKYAAPQAGSEAYVIPIDDAKKLILRELRAERAN